MSAPVDPFPNFLPHATADPDQTDARFLALFNALDVSKVGLDAASIKNGMLKLALQATEAFQTLTLSSVPGTLEYQRDLLGMVRTRPKAYTWNGSQSIANNAVLGTLPVGYRPGVLSAARLWTVLPGSSGINPYWLDISTAGVMTYRGFGLTPAAGSISVIHGSWRAEN